MNDSAKKLPIVAVTIFVIFVLGAITWQVGYISFNKSPNKNISPITGTRVVSGTVTEVGDSYMKIEITAGPMNTMPGNSIRVATVNKDTAIEKLVAKDSAILNKEMQDFLKKTQESSGTGAGAKTPSVITSMVNPPEPFTHEKISLADIQVGDRVTAFTDEDITEADKFTATKISVHKIVQPDTILSTPTQLPK